MAWKLEMSVRKMVKLSANKHKLDNKATVKALIKTDRKQQHGLVTDTILKHKETWSVQVT